jgi:CheY-like chemotaxis protein
MTQISDRNIVLVVEDESLLRWHAVDVVEGAGFVALEAADADEALRILAEHPDIKILFTDINMPGSLDGLKLAQLVHERYPQIKLIVTSGKIAPSSEELPEDGVFIAKPYSADSVACHLVSLA